MTIVAGNSTSSAVGLLGYLTFASVGDLKVDKKDLENMFIGAGLSLQTYQPGDIRPSDAFRRATSLLKNKRITVQYNGVQRTAVIDVTEFPADNEILRYIGRKIVDDKNKKLDFQEVSLLHFDRSTNQVTFDPVDQSLLSETAYDQMLQDTIHLYTEWCQFHTKDTVRNILNKVVNSLNPVPVTAIPGEPSVAKFVPVAYTAELEGIKKVITELGPHHLNNAASAVQYVELYESNTNKLMINAAVHGDVKAKVQSLVIELQEMLKKNGSVPVETGKRLAKKLLEMKSEVAEYENLLGTSMQALEMQIATAILKVDEAPRPQQKDAALGSVL